MRPMINHGRPTTLNELEAMMAEEVKMLDEEAVKARRKIIGSLTVRNLDACLRSASTRMPWWRRLATVGEVGTGALARGLASRTMKGCPSLPLSSINQPPTKPEFVLRLRGGWVWLVKEKEDGVQWVRKFSPVVARVPCRECWHVKWYQDMPFHDTLFLVHRLAFKVWLWWGVRQFRARKIKERKNADD